MGIAIGDFFTQRLEPTRQPEDVRMWERFNSKISLMDIYTYEVVCEFSTPFASWFKVGLMAYIRPNGYVYKTR